MKLKKKVFLFQSVIELGNFYEKDYNNHTQFMSDLY